MPDYRGSLFDQNPPIISFTCPGGGWESIILIGTTGTKQDMSHTQWYIPTHPYHS